MLSAALGIDMSSPDGLLAVVAIVAIVCLFIGYLADCALAKRGFGITGNVLVLEGGVYLTLWFLDRYVAVRYALSPSAAIIVSASMAALLLVSLSALKRRLATI